MIAKSTFLILSVFLLSNVLIGQNDFPSVTLASTSSNKAHPLYDVLIKKDARYIKWLYFHCKGLNNKNTLHQPMNKPLVFSVTLDGSLVEDTISNCVYPKLYEDEREPEWQSEIPLYGNFPDYINFHLTNDPNKVTTIDLSINRTSASIKMYVLTDEGDLVSTLIDKTLKQGNHTLNWDNEDFKSGTYLLFTEIDTHLTIHPITVEKNWWANLFSRSKETSRSKKIYQIIFESSNIQRPEREIHYILRNRFGTSVGVNLLDESMVTIKLFSIRGDYISTINSKKLNKGESEFLLDPHIEKSGWYLIQLSINNKVKHIKTNIKK